jgi:hypothetical protein
MWTGACKKAEKQEGASGVKQAPRQGAAAKKERQKRKPGAREARATKQAAQVKQAGGTIPLEIYNEKVLVTSIPPDPSFTATKIKIDNNEVDAVLLRDLLAKHKVQGKNVIVSGPARSITLTWEQATAEGVYLTVNPAKIISVYSASPDFAKLGLPKRIVRITVSASPQLAASAQAPKKKTN